MLRLPGLLGLVPRRYRPLAASILLVAFLFVLYTRSSIRLAEHDGTFLQSSAAKDAETKGSRPDEEKGKTLQTAPSVDSLTTAVPIPVIIFAFNRANDLRLTIDSVLAASSFLPSLHPIFISQDGDDEAVTEVIASYGDRVTHLEYHWPGKSHRKTRTGYLHIAGHYQFALTEVMDNVDGHEHWDCIIMLEDDMYVSPDVFSYFRRMTPLFDVDPTLYCVSAWNENGQSQFVSSPTTVYRTDCFPGLGWMWSRAIWHELREWTPGFWDDWLRDPAQRKGRSCIYPEINRVYTFGSEGASHGKFFEEWFKDIKLNEENVDWNALDVDHLLPGRYNEWLTNRLRATVRVSGIEEAKAAIDNELDNVQSAMANISERSFEYRNLTDLTDIMKPIGLIYDHKAGLPRTSYKGALQFRYRGVRIWIIPEKLHLLLH